MVTSHAILLLLALVCFLLAAKPPAGYAVRFEWLGAVFLILAWLF